MKNNRSAFIHSDFVINAIRELKGTGCIREADNPFIINPLTVSVNASWKKRLVLDLRYVNQFVEKQMIKFEGVTEGLEYAKKNMFMIKFDLKSGYHHIDIHPNYQKYLGFRWNV